MNSETLLGDCIVLKLHGSISDNRRLNPLRSKVCDCFLFVTCLLLGFLTGCVIIPTPEHTLLEGRGKIEESDMVFLENAKTTREEVLLRFGEPDLVLDKDRILVYHWAVSHGYWFVGAYYTGAGGPIPKDYLFMLEFDEEGMLKRYDRSGRIWASAQARIDKWTPRGIDKPPGKCDPSHGLIRRHRHHFRNESPCP